MKFKVLISVVFFVFKVLANQPSQQFEFENSPKSEIVNSDSLMQGLFKDTISIPKTPTINSKTIVRTIDKNELQKPDDIKIVDLPKPSSDSIIPYIIPEKFRKVHVDSLLFLANPFFIELVYNGLPFDFKWDIQPDFRKLYYGKEASTFSDCLFRPIKNSMVINIYVYV